MGICVRISLEHHQIAKQKANALGFKLHRFVEMAVESFNPSLRRDRACKRKTRRAG